MDLQKKLALVTGSTSGIGLSIAHALAKAGCSVIITGLGDERTITGIVNTIERKFHVHCAYIGADLRKVSEIKVLIAETLKRHPGGIDILVNNAGVFHLYAVDKYPDEEWDSMIAVNLSAPFQLIKGFLPAMKKKRWGRIVNIDSTLGQKGLKKTIGYTASKHGLLGLTKCVSLYCAETGITCNAVSPGLADTPMGETVLNGLARDNGTSVKEERDKFVATAADKKLVQPENVAELVLFIVASGASNQMTGASYLVDGGYSAQ